MGLDLWFREDVERILNQAVASGLDRGRPLYGPDYFKAIHVIAIGFGITVTLPQNVPELVEQND